MSPESCTPLDRSAEQETPRSGRSRQSALMSDGHEEEADWQGKARQGSHGQRRCGSSARSVCRLSNLSYFLSLALWHARLPLCPSAPLPLCPSALQLACSSRASSLGPCPRLPLPSAYSRWRDRLDRLEDALARLDAARTPACRIRPWRRCVSMHLDSVQSARLLPPWRRPF